MNEPPRKLAREPSPTRATLRIATTLRLALALAMFAAAQAAAAVEFGVDTDTTNIHIPWWRTAPLTVDKLPRDYFFWGFDAWFSAPVGEDASIRFAFDRDQVLRNSFLTSVQFERGIARISAGPTFGFGNSDSCPFSAGMSASLRLQWPGVAYVSVRSDGGTAIFSFQDKAEPQSMTVLAAGFYVPYAIVSGVVTVKRFNELDDAGELVTDSLTRYAMTIDVFKKNVPYTAMLSLGYERRAKTYDSYGQTDALGSLFLGIDATAEITSGLTLKGGLSTAAYVFGLEELRGRGPGSTAYMFALDFGVSIDTEKLPKGSPGDELKAVEPAAQAEATPAETPAAVPEDPAKEAAEKAQPAKAEKSETEAKAEEEAAAKPEEASAEKPADAQGEAEPEAEKPSFPRLALDIGGGLYYNDMLKLSSDIPAVVEHLFNSRIGLTGYAGYRITPSLAIGLDVAYDYFTLSSSGVELTIWDLPVRLDLSYSLGKARIECFTGAFFNGISASGEGSTLYTDYDLGLRARLLGFFAEASYVIGMSSKGISVVGVDSVADNYLRFGLGYAYKIK